MVDRTEKECIFHPQLSSLSKHFMQKDMPLPYCFGKKVSAVFKLKTVSDLEEVVKDAFVREHISVCLKWL